MGGGLLLGQVLGGAGVRYLPRMKIQMTVAGVVATAFTSAVAISSASTEERTTAFILIGTIGAGYVENLTLSSTAYLWDPADMGKLMLSYARYQAKMTRSRYRCLGSYPHSGFCDCNKHVLFYPCN